MFMLINGKLITFRLLIIEIIDSDNISLDL